MSVKYASHVTKKNVPQTEQVDSRQVRNSAGGFAFAVDDWTRLDRFLILGNEKGTYYASERKLTKDAAQCILRCHKDDAKRTVDTIVDVSVNNRAPKQEPAIFALSLLAQDPLALAAIPKVCRTSTHLFQFLDNVQEFRGWGRALRNAIATWYTSKKRSDLVYQVTKYRQREGWTHRDVLRLAHPQSDELNDIFAWIVGKLDLSKVASEDEALNKLAVFEEIQRTTDARKAAQLIRDNRLVREHVPTELLNSKEVWEALLEDMPVTALVRNLGKLSSVGLLVPLSNASKLVVSKLQDTEALRRGRVHPFSLLLAQDTYGHGHGVRGSLTWNVVPQVVQALDDAFYASFGLLEPSNKNYLLGIDVSGSMCGGGVAGSHITPNKAAAAMAMVAARTEPNYYFMGFAHTFRDLGITARDSLDTAMRKCQVASFGSTDCSLPMKWALENKIEVDMFCVYTDSETYAGRGHPHICIQEYRNKMGRNAKLVVVGLVANDFTIADPTDAGMMDVVGFDASAPSVMREFAIA